MSRTVQLLRAADRLRAVKERLALAYKIPEVQSMAHELEEIADTLDTLRLEEEAPKG